MQLVSNSSPANLAWFTHDLRLHDNAVLDHIVAAHQQEAKPLLCFYCIDPQWFVSDRFGMRSMGEHRWRFLVESLRDLDQQLRTVGQRLVIAKGNPVEVVADILSRYNITHVVASRQSGYNEQQLWEKIQAQQVCNSPKARHTFITCDTFTLFSRQQLPSKTVNPLPNSFSRFRTRIESSDVMAQLYDSIKPTPYKLPPVFYITLAKQHQYTLPDVTDTQAWFYGGEQQGIQHLAQYFSGIAPKHYKDTRNALGCEQDEWQNSTKFSPWLANGNLSARYIAKILHEYEQEFGANQSTYWILFELLWREYFQWYAREYGTKLFRPQGIQTRVPLATFYPQRFHQWCHGNTPWPLVNACMKQLKQTGFLSNRGRQIVASCLVNELGIDWRCGAAYFEQQLIDYDVAANWGNWQYIAGVGADPRGGRHFNILKQQQQYDPEKTYIKRWQGDVDISTNTSSIDSVDAADWPIGYE